MSFLTEQRVDDTGLFMKSSGGRQFFISSADMKALYVANSSSKNGATDALKAQIAAAMGPAVDTTKAFFDFDPATGKVLESTLGTGTSIDTKGGTK